MKTFKIGQRVNVRPIKKEGYYCNGCSCDNAIYNGENEYGTIHIRTDEQTIQHSWNHVNSGWYSKGAYKITPNI